MTANSGSVAGGHWSGRTALEMNSAVLTRVAVGGGSATSTSGAPGSVSGGAGAAGAAGAASSHHSSVTPAAAGAAAGAACAAAGARRLGAHSGRPLCSACRPLVEQAAARSRACASGASALQRAAPASRPAALRSSAILSRQRPRRWGSALFDPPGTTQPSCRA